jgi:hypothetical protein
VATVITSKSVIVAKISIFMYLILTFTLQNNIKIIPKDEVMGFCTCSTQFPLSNVVFLQDILLYDTYVQSRLYTRSMMEKTAFSLRCQHVLARPVHALLELQTRARHQSKVHKIKNTE